MKRLGQAVREQEEAVNRAVRTMYLHAAMADVAAATSNRDSLNVTGNCGRCHECRLDRCKAISHIVLYFAPRLS